MSASSQYYSVTARVGVPHRHEVEVTIPLVGPTGATGPAGAAGASAWNDITGKPSTFAPSAHTHAANEITSGTLDNARINFAAPAAIGSGTPNTGAFASIRVDPKTGGTGSLVVGSTTAGETDRIVLDFDGIKIRAPGSDQVATIAAPTLLSENRSYQLPNASGTLALTESADNVFRVVGSSDATKKVAFEVDANVPTTSTVALTVPAASGTIARAEDFASPPSIGSTTANAGSFTTLSANNGTIAASAPVLDLAQTWNGSGVNFTAMRVNATNTLSGSASLLADFQLGGVSELQIRNNGELRFRRTPAVLSTLVAGNYATWIQGVYNGTTDILSRNLTIGGGGTGGPVIFATEGASGVLGIRDGTTAQEARLYGTYTSATNYQRMTVKSVKQTLSALSGASATTTGTFIPDGAVVVGVTTRVSTAITGATGYQVGDGTDADRWGDITGTAVGTTSDNRDWTAGTIECFTVGGNITLTAKTSNFTAGAVEICVFYLAGEAD